MAGPMTWRNNTQRELPYFVPHRALRLNGQAAYTDADVTVDQGVRLGQASLPVLSLFGLLGSGILFVLEELWRALGPRRNQCWVIG